MSNTITWRWKIEILFFSEHQRWEHAISEFFQLGTLDEAQKIIINDFVHWLLQSIVYDTKTKSWKYKSFEKGKRGSFTFPMYQKESPTQIRLLEIYANREAYESHLKTPHFQHYKTSTLKMVKSLKLIDMNAMNPQTMAEIFRKLK